MTSPGRLQTMLAPRTHVHASPRARGRGAGSFPVLAVSILLLSLPLNGCGGASSLASPSTASATTLTIWYGTDDPVERSWSQQLARRFEATHPKVKVSLTDYSFEDINTKLQLGLSAGTPPDLAYVTPRGPGIPAYVQGHRLADLTAAAQRNGWTSALRPGLLHEYNQPFSFIGARKGEVVAVPMALAAVSIMVNTRLLHRLNLTVPRSLAEFQRALAVARRAGFTPLGMGNADGWLGDDWYLTLVNAQMPPHTLSPEQRLSPTFTFHQPPFLTAARTLDAWSRAGYFTKDFGGLDAQEGIDLFFRGTTLFQLISSSQNPQIIQDEASTRLPISVFAFPAAYGGTVSPQSGYEGWVVPRGARHPHEAVSFITHVLSPETTRFLLAQGVLPAHGALSGGGKTAAAPRTSPSFAVASMQAVDAAHAGVYLDAAPIANMNATMEANVQLLLHGYEPPEFLVKSLQEVYATRGKKGSTQRIDGEF